MQDANNESHKNKLEEEELRKAKGEADKVEAEVATEKEKAKKTRAEAYKTEKDGDSRKWENPTKCLVVALGGVVTLVAIYLKYVLEEDD